MLVFRNTGELNLFFSERFDNFTTFGYNNTLFIVIPSSKKINWVYKFIWEYISIRVFRTKHRSGLGVNQTNGITIISQFFFCHKLHIQIKIVFLNCFVNLLLNNRSISTQTITYTNGPAKWTPKEQIVLVKIQKIFPSFFLCF